MMKKLFAVLMFISVALMGCQNKQNAQPYIPAPPLEVTTQSVTGPINLPSGAEVSVFSGWKIFKYEDHVEFLSPENDMRVGYYELSAEKYFSVNNAIDAAIYRYLPNANFLLLEGKMQKHKNVKGYKIVGQKEYFNFQNMNLIINAVQKHEDTWYAFVLGGSINAFETRANEAQNIYDSFKRADEVAKLKADAEHIASLKPRPFDEKTANAIDTIVQNYLDNLGTPGAAIVIVQDGKVVHSKGYGKRIYGQDLPVTEKTLFPIGSVSKMFTSYLAAEAVHQGKINWDTPIYTLLPEFVTGSKEYTQQITIQHALSMTSGLPRRDFTWGFRNDDAAGVIKEMAHIQSVTQPGLRFIYCNHGVASAGYAIARTFVPEGSLDEAWKKAMQTIVLDPLGMTSSTYDFAKVQTMEYAAPTAQDIQFQHISTPMSVHEHLQGYAPAGALWSNAEDLGKFMIAELANQDPVHAKRWEPAITISGTMQYGFGFFLDQQNGIKTRYHGGAINGAKAQIAFYPDQNFAIAVMENDGLGGVNKIFETIASDIIFEDPENWSIDKNYDKKLPQAREILKKEANLNTKDLQLTPDAAWLNSLVGKYHGKELGDIEISIVNGKGVMKTPYWESEFGRKNKYGKDMLVMLQFPHPGLIAFEVKTRFGKVTKLVLTEDQKIAKYTYVLNKI